MRRRLSRLLNGGCQNSSSYTSPARSSRMPPDVQSKGARSRVRVIPEKKGEEQSTETVKSSQRQVDFSSHSRSARVSGRGETRGTHSGRRPVPLISGVTRWTVSRKSAGASCSLRDSQHHSERPDVIVRPAALAGVHGRRPETHVFRADNRCSRPNGRRRGAAWCMSSGSQSRWNSQFHPPKLRERLRIAGDGDRVQHGWLGRSMTHIHRHLRVKRPGPPRAPSCCRCYQRGSTEVTGNGHGALYTRECAAASADWQEYQSAGSVPPGRSAPEQRWQRPSSSPAVTRLSET